MKNLAAYLEQKNSWARIFGGKEYNVRNLDQAAAGEIAEMLASDLSPENITCDGELDHYTVQRRRSVYTLAVKDLQSRFNVEVIY